MTTAKAPASALCDLRVVELGQMIAGPFAGSVLAQFGADVIKVEAPGGDPIRRWRGMVGDTSLWWRQLSRNKRSAVIDLRTQSGRDVVRRLVGGADVLIENFRPGTLERWNLSPAALRREHPRLIVARVSGYGQDGPRARHPGFASVCEAYAGLRHLTGMPGELPVRANLSLGDTLAGLHAVLGILVALRHRERTGVGQEVDASIVESVLAVLESVIPEYDRLGIVRQASGSTITGVVPTGTYRASDGVAIVIGANSEPSFARLCGALGAPELAADPRYDDNAHRVANQASLEQTIARWVGARSAGEAIAALEAAGVPCSRIHTAADIAGDAHLRAAASSRTSRSTAGPSR